MATFPLYNTDTDPCAQQLEKTEVPYTYRQICDMLPELDLETAKELQSQVLSRIVGYLIIYNTQSMIGLLMMLECAIRSLENGESLDWLTEEWDEEEDNGGYDTEENQD